MTWNNQSQPNTWQGARSRWPKRGWWRTPSNLAQSVTKKNVRLRLCECFQNSRYCGIISKGSRKSSEYNRKKGPFPTTSSVQQQLMMSHAAHAQPACFLLMGNMVLRLGFKKTSISVQAHCPSVVVYIWCVLQPSSAFKLMLLRSDSDAATRRCKATEPKQAIVADSDHFT